MFFFLLYSNPAKNTMTKKRKNPSYLALHRDGTLQERARAARQLLRNCTVCPHACGVNRLAGELGKCRIGGRARVASFGAHFGEEAPLVGKSGSGTIFFEGCNLHCIFCQNHDISHIDSQGDTSPQAVADADLAAIMLNLQGQGCHNINLVTPTHVVPQIIAALPLAVEQGLRLPLVYNSSGYDHPPTLRLLAGIVDIYMPDCKFWTAEAAARYTNAGDYPAVMQSALREMHRQVGELLIDEAGLAWRGLLVRHLVMPGLLAETRGVLEFLAREIGKATYVNIMDQYHPCHLAFGDAAINRPLRKDEYGQALAMAEELGLQRLDRRDWPGLLCRLFGR
jgi:putative pyruvate formate lyase activating enzyme